MSSSGSIETLQLLRETLFRAGVLAEELVVVDDAHESRFLDVAVELQRLSWAVEDQLRAAVIREATR